MRGTCALGTTGQTGIVHLDRQSVAGGHAAGSTGMGIGISGYDTRGARCGVRLGIYHFSQQLAGVYWFSTGEIARDFDSQIYQRKL